jgi:hypothetical protein
MMSRYQILKKHTIIDMFCMKWTAQLIYHIGLHIQYYHEKFVFPEQINYGVYLSVVISYNVWRHTDQSF